MSITSKGLQEIREIRDRWASMPVEEFVAEQQKLYTTAKRRLARMEKRMKEQKKR